MMERPGRTTSLIYTMVMKLPYYENVVVRPDKITAYLLSESHPNGRHKGSFFMRFGFSINNWQQLSNALLKHAEEHEIAGVEPSPFGTRYIIEGNMESPDMRNPRIRSVWFIETESVIPYFVTAYPLKGK